MKSIRGTVHALHDGSSCYWMQNPVEVMEPPLSNDRTGGRFEMLIVIGVLLLGLGSAVGGWTFNLLIPLLVLAVVYGVVRDVMVIVRLKTSDGRARAMPPGSPTENKRCAQSPGPEN